jgi:hypothetical protein
MREDQQRGGLVLLALLGLKVHDAIAELASAVRGGSDGGSAIQRGFESAGEAVGDAPVLGEPLAGALRDARRYRWSDGAGRTRGR